LGPEDFAEIVRIEGNLVLRSEKDHEAMEPIVFSTPKNLLGGFLIFWFVLYQDKMRRRFSCFEACLKYFYPDLFHSEYQTIEATNLLRPLKSRIKAMVKASHQSLADLTKCTIWNEWDCL
jgi:hypothetical protein